MLTYKIKEVQFLKDLVIYIVFYMLVCSMTSFVSIFTQL